jgi:hypothetical protein
VPPGSGTSGAPAVDEHAVSQGLVHVDGRGQSAAEVAVATTARTGGPESWTQVPGSTSRRQYATPNRRPDARSALGALRRR